jgi:hypothetical protein
VYNQIRIVGGFTVLELRRLSPDVLALVFSGMLQSLSANAAIVP